MKPSLIEYQLAVVRRWCIWGFVYLPARPNVPLGTGGPDCASWRGYLERGMNFEFSIRERRTLNAELILNFA